MKLNKVLIIFSSILLLNSFVYAKCKTPLNMNINGLKIDTFIQSVAKITNKNILFTNKINGQIDFISNKAICKEELFSILLYILENKGYTIIENGGISRIIKINDSAKNNLPVIAEGTDKKYYQMITQIFSVDFSNVDYVTAKIRHLLSRSAKLVTDKETNSIIITDFQNNINTIKSVINLIAKDKKKHIITHDLKNANATSLATELQNIAKSVFNQNVEKEKVSVIVNKDTNSLMLIGKKYNVEFLQKELLRIDSQSSLVEKTVEVIGLKNIEAKNVLKIINSINDKKLYPDKNSKPFVSADDESNSIILMGPKDELTYLKTLIDKLDIDKQQVYVLARIIELSESGTSNMGIKYGIEGLKSGGAGALTFAGNLGGASIALSEATRSAIDIPNVEDGIVLGTSINLLKQNSALDIVSEPSLLCINNKESSIYVGETTSISTQTNNGTTTSTSYEREDIGLKLKVKPRISNGDKVTLEINAVLEDVSKVYENGNIPPDTNKKELSTLAIVNNGESVILGGLVKNKILNTNDKVPFLGDLPLVGGLFRNNLDTTDKTNLVIVVTPYIIPKSKDLSYVREQLAELKILEDKYTKDMSLRLEQKRLQTGNEDLIREQKRLELKQQSLELKQEMINYVDEEKEINEDIKEELNEIHEDSYLQNKRVKKIFGI